MHVYPTLSALLVVTASLLTGLVITSHQLHSRPLSLARRWPTASAQMTQEGELKLSQPASSDLSSSEQLLLLIFSQPFSG